MGRNVTDIQDPDYEFTAEEIQEAIEKKPGRPSKRVRELRIRIKEAQRLQDILKILDTGVVERLVGGLTEGGRPGDPERTVRVDPAAKGFTSDLLLKTGLVNKKFLKTNQALLELSDEVVKNALVNYGPPIIAVVGGLAGIWIAEGQIEDMPPVLHTSVELLMQLLRLFTVLGNFISGGLGGLTDLINDPIGTLLDPILDPIQETVEQLLDPFTPDPVARRKKLDDMIERSKERRKQKTGIFRKKGVG